MKPGRRDVPIVMAALVAATAVVVLTGWVFDIRAFKTVLPGMVCMNPMTAVSFLAFAGSLALHRLRRGAARAVSMALAAIGIAVGGSKLLDLFLGTGLGFDQFLFRDQLGVIPGQAPNRMAPNTALNLALLGTALILSWNGNAWRRAYAFAIPSFLLAFLAMMGYVFGVKPLYGLLNYVPMALHASVCFLLTATAVFYLHPDKGLAGILASPGPGGILARRLLPAMILFPTVLGWLEIQGERHGLYDAEMGLALLMLAIMAGLIALVAWSAASLDRLHESRLRVHEALLRAKETAEEANRSKSRFLATMSHELRTPLNSIIGFTHILIRNKGGRLNHDDLNFLGRVASNGKHLLSLINDILDLSKVEAGKMEVMIARCRVDELVRQTVAQLEGQLSGKPVILRHDLPEGGLGLDTDEDKLRQVLINLVGNAVKFTDAGEVTVAVDVDRESRRPVAIRVSDTGIGIAADRLETVFEAFRQADAGFSRAYQGTGLGLTISRSLCGLLGYGLEVASTPGKGSTFTIRLESPAAPVSSR